MILEADHNLLTDLTLGQLLGIIVTIGLIIGMIRTIHPIMHKLNNLLDDWNGEGERPGVPERKGVMKRLSDQDTALATVQQSITDQNEVLSHLRKKIEPIVDETQAGNHQEVLRNLRDIQDTTHSNHSRLRTLERLLNRHISESKEWVSRVDKAAAEKDFVMPPWPTLPETEGPFDESD